MNQLAVKAEELRKELSETIVALLQKEGTNHGCSDSEIALMDDLSMLKKIATDLQQFNNER